MSNGTETEKRTSIGRKVSIAFIVPLLLFALLFSGILYVVAMNIINQHVLTQFEQRLVMTMEKLTEQVEAAEVEKALQDKGAYQELFQKLTQFVGEHEGLQNAYVIAKTNGKDVILALSNEDMYMTELPFTPEQNQALESGSPVMSDIYVDEWGVHKSLFVPYPDQQAVVGIDMDAAFIYELGQFILWLSVGFVAASVVVGIVAGRLVSRSLVNPLVHLVNRTKQLAAGNLSEVITSSRTDEIGQLTRTFEEMRQSLAGMIESVRNNAETIRINSDTLSRASEELSAASTQVSATLVSEVNSAEQRARHLETVTNMVKAVAEATQQVEHQLSAISRLSDGAQSLAEQGNTQVEELTAQMGEIQTQGAATSEKLRNLEQRSKEISNVINIIREIAAQINLLSLNASIEAARAGEHGKGFAVVAQEVQKLAKQTNDSVDYIIESVNEITTETDEVLRANELSAREIEKGVIMIQENGKLFHRIAEAVADIAAGMTSIVRQSEEIAHSTATTLASVEEISVISEESVATTEEISASMQQQNASIQQLEAMSGELRNMSQQLAARISSFTL